MSMKDGKGMVAADVKCPFYRRHDKSRIICDGFTRGSHICMQFASVGRREAYMHDRCMSIDRYGSCGLCDALMDAYEERSRQNAEKQVRKQKDHH